ncbi:hypothetical protein EKK58_04725 [Candidatus Dependentiae bacterium]|nr:MAG: hypothetical protein EKK58_04725 [Candidatus Dependentiae bacterium]
MISRNSLFLNTLLITTALANFTIFANQQIKSSNITQLAVYTTNEQLDSFTDFINTLPSLLSELSNNEIASLLNILAAQFFLFELMEKEFNNNKVDQEKLEGMMQGFQNALKTLETQCNEKTKALYEKIQLAIASIVPQEVAKRIQDLQEKMQAAYTKAKDKNNAQLKNEMLDFQNKLMEDFLILQTITSLATLEIYKKVYETAAKKNKNLLLRRFNENGIIPLTKRKDEVTHPDKASMLIKSFLKQTEALAAQNAQ